MRQYLVMLCKIRTNIFINTMMLKIFIKRIYIKEKIFQYNIIFLRDTYMRKIIYNIFEYLTLFYLKFDD